MGSLHIKGCRVSVHFSIPLRRWGFVTADSRQPTTRKKEGADLMVATLHFPLIRLTFRWCSLSGLSILFCFHSLVCFTLSLSLPNHTIPIKFHGTNSFSCLQYLSVRTVAGPADGIEIQCLVYVCALLPSNHYHNKATMWNNVKRFLLATR